MPELPPPDPKASVRIDLWAWSVRLFKTRSLAATACENARILVNGSRCRASRAVRVGDEVTVRHGLLERTIEVRRLLRRRVAAKEVGDYLRELTPPEEYERVAELRRAARASAPKRDRGLGRPTKRDRRGLDSLASPEQEES